MVLCVTVSSELVKKKCDEPNNRSDPFSEIVAKKTLDVVARILPHPWNEQTFVTHQQTPLGSTLPGVRPAVTQQPLSLNVSLDLAVYRPFCGVVRYNMKGRCINLLVKRMFTTILSSTLAHPSNTVSLLLV